jgi:hypothetical protein
VIEGLDSAGGIGWLIVYMNDLSGLFGERGRNRTYNLD